MSVRPIQLENPERDMNLTVRDTKRREQQREDVARSKGQSVLYARLEGAKGLKPAGKQLHWAECWNKGRDAAIGAIEAEGGTSLARSMEAPAGLGCRQCFKNGRDAVIQVVEAL